jgi:hypothetical protein
MTDYTQPKQLKITQLSNKDEFHPGGFLFFIIDNDGVTIIKEWWDSDRSMGIQFCRNWLKVQAGEELDYSQYKMGVTNAITTEVG